MAEAVVVGKPGQDVVVQDTQAAVVAAAAVVIATDY